MTIQEYIELNHLKLYQIVKNITKSDQLCDDLYQYCILILLEYDKDKIELVISKGHLTFFFATIVMNQWNSSTSPFFKVYRQKNIEFNENMDIPDEDYDGTFDPKIEWIMEELNQEHFYIKKLIELKYFENGGASYQQIANYTKIPKSSLFSTHKIFKEKLIEKYNKINNIK